MSKKLRIGVFGGYRGECMIKILLRHADAELVAVCDKYEPILEKVRAKADEAGLHVETFNNFEDFIEYPMDAVVLANYAHEHAPYAVKCMKKGLHVLSEVLPCETMAQAVELIETVEETGKVYAYAENYCYMRHTFEMWQRYKKGEFGTVQYAEGEYIHDCTSVWPSISYGDPDHWRNNLYPTYYCTHSLGPILTTTGLRPVKVVGFETCNNPEVYDKVGVSCAAGIIMATLENGAVVKSIHGGLKREPASVNYQLYGTRGMMESGRHKELPALYAYKEGERYCEGEWEKYDPVGPIKEATEISPSHNGSDYYPTHYFIQKILGRPEGNEWSIDVYKAVDMGICGILAYRSILNGNVPVEIPDLRIKAERDKYRNDNACTNKALASGDDLLPTSSFRYPKPSDEIYAYVRDLWLKGEKA